jgi:mono/diheme cytochrome c family protein
MKILALLAALAVFAFTFVVKSATQSNQALLERGRYLVENVAQCSQCHSPRDERGEIDPQRRLRGGPVRFAPTFPVKNWAYQAPALAGMHVLTEADAVELLATGRRLDGTQPRWPMPPFRFSREDATAIVSYLASLSAE